MTCCTSILLGAPLCGLFLLAPGLAAVALPGARSQRPGCARAHDRPARALHPLRSSRFSSLRRRSGLGASLAPWALTRNRRRGDRVCVAATVAIGPWPGSVLRASNWDGRGTIDTSPEHVHALESAIALVPSHASVAATEPSRVTSLCTPTHLQRPLRRLGGVGRSGMSDPWTPDNSGGRSDPEDLLRSGNGWKRAELGIGLRRRSGSSCSSGRRDERRRSCSRRREGLVARAGDRETRAWEIGSGPR